MFDRRIVFSMNFVLRETFCFDGKLSSPKTPKNLTRLPNVDNSFLWSKPILQVYTIFFMPGKQSRKPSNNNKFGKTRKNNCRHI